MGCGCGRDEGRAGKTEVARGGWAEDARRPPATFFGFRSDSFCRTWVRGGALDIDYGGGGA
jgi:hypothetical protein